MKAFVFVVCICNVVLANTALAETEHATYANHYDGGGGKNPLFATGDIAISHPTRGQSVATGITITIAMSGYPNGSIQDWVMAQTSSWDVGGSIDSGSWSVVASPVHPNSWTPNPNGTFNVSLQVALPTTAGSHTLDIEIYGACTKCRCAIIPPTGSTNWKIPAHLSWTTDNTGTVTSFDQVQFLALDQTQGIYGFSPYFPSRQQGTYSDSQILLAPTSNCSEQTVWSCPAYDFCAPCCCRRHYHRCHWCYCCQ